MISKCILILTFFFFFFLITSILEQLKSNLEIKQSENSETGYFLHYETASFLFFFFKSKLAIIEKIWLLQKSFVCVCAESLFHFQK